MFSAFSQPREMAKYSVSAITMTCSLSRGRPPVRKHEPGEQILPCKRPFERTGGRFVSTLKREQAGFERSQVSEIGRGQHLALDDREIDLDLVEPTGVDRGEDRDQRRPLALESLEAAAMPAAVDYLYFVSRNDGSHVFASTLEEHNRNVQEYQVRYFREKPE